MSTKISAPVIFAYSTIVILAIGVFFVVPSSVPLSAQGSGEQKFGFGDSGLLPTNWIARGYTCLTFYDGIFLTPPYPSVYVWQLGATDQWNQTGGTTQKFLDCVGSKLNSNQYLILLFGMNTGVGCCVYDPDALTWFETYARHLASESFKNQLLIGLDGEHSQGMNQTQFNSMLSYIQSLGIGNANRYLGNNHDPYLTPVNDLQTTNWPFGDQESDVKTPSGGGYIGAFVGVIDGAPYPFGGCGAPYGDQTSTLGYPGWTDNPVAQGYVGSAANSEPCSQNWPYDGATVGTIQDVLAQNANNPNASFVVFVNNWVCPGWPPQSKGGAVCFSPLFTGVSGIQTNYQIDNPQFRNTIWQWIEAHDGIYQLGNATTKTTSSTVTSSGLTSMTHSLSSGATSSTSTTFTTSSRNSTTSGIITQTQHTSHITSSSASTFSSNTTEPVSTSANTTWIALSYTATAAVATLVVAWMLLTEKGRRLVRFRSKP